MEQAGYAIYRPTFAERFWRALGYRWRVVEMSPEGEKLPGWMKTEAFVDVSLADRLRLLLSGKCALIVETRTDVPVDTAISASAFIVLRPGHER